MNEREQAMKKALRTYRAHGKGLFDRMFPELPGNAMSVVGALNFMLDGAYRQLGSYAVETDWLTAEHVDHIVQALQLPAKVVYAPDGTFYIPDECMAVSQLQRTVRNYCQMAALVARVVSPAAADAWQAAYETINSSCRIDTLAGCTPEDARDIGRMLTRETPALADAVRRFWPQLRERIDGLLEKLNRELREALERLRGVADARFVAAVTRDFAHASFDDLLAFVDLAMLYGRHALEPDYESPDVGELRKNFEALIRARFAGNETQISACREQLEELLGDLERIEVAFIDQIDGVPVPCHKLYEWLKDAPQDTSLTKADLEAAFAKVVGQATAHPPTESAPKSTFKFAGKLLKRADGAWIKVEKDGVTLTCPTRLGDQVRPRSYTFPNASQIAFLEPLLERFESGEWYKPTVNKSEWQGRYFKRGDAKRFHDDHHIALWQYQDGGCRGSIRLSVPLRQT